MTPAPGTRPGPRPPDDLLPPAERVWPAGQYLGVKRNQPAAGDGRVASPDGFEAAFREYFPLVYRFIARRVGPAIAEDLAAETFATAYRRRAVFDPGRGSLRSWLLGIAANLVRSHWRAEQHLLDLDARLVPEIEPVDDSSAADQRLAAALLAPRLAAALGQLTADRGTTPTPRPGARSQPRSARPTSGCWPWSWPYSPGSAYSTPCSWQPGNASMIWESSRPSG